MSDARWNDSRENDARDQGNEWPRVYDPRDRDERDPRDGLMRDLDLPRGDERELVVDRDRVYELDGEDSRTLAAVGAFRIVPEHDLDVPHDSVENLHDQRLVALVDLGDSERRLTLTREGRDLLDSHSLERDGGSHPRARRRCSGPPSEQLGDGWALAVGNLELQRNRVAHENLLFGGASWTRTRSASGCFDIWRLYRFFAVQLPMA